MPRLRKPTSALGSLAQIRKAAETAENDNKNGGSYLSQEIVDRCTSFVPRMEQQVNDINKYKSLTQKEIEEKNTINDLVKTYIRDIWEGIRRRVYREKLSLDVFPFYQLPKSGMNPSLTNVGQWLEVAGQIIKGEEDAIKAGFKPMANPSVSELKEKLEIARDENKDVAVADRLLDEAEESVAELMPEALDIVDHIIAELNFRLFKKDPASRRRIMRNYGVRFDLTKNEEPEDETDVAAE